MKFALFGLCLLLCATGCTKRIMMRSPAGSIVNRIDQHEIHMRFLRSAHETDTPEAKISFLAYNEHSSEPWVIRENMFRIGRENPPPANSCDDIIARVLPKSSTVVEIQCPIDEPGKYYVQVADGGILLEDAVLIGDYQPPRQVFRLLLALLVVAGAAAL